MRTVSRPVRRSFSVWRGGNQLSRKPQIRSASWRKKNNTMTMSTVPVTTSPAVVSPVRADCSTAPPDATPWMRDQISWTAAPSTANGNRALASCRVCHPCCAAAMRESHWSATAHTTAAMNAASTTRIPTNVVSVASTRGHPRSLSRRTSGNTAHARMSATSCMRS